MSILIDELFHRVVDMPPDARAQYLDSLQLDEGMRRELESLLAYDTGSTGPPGAPIAAAAGLLLNELDPTGLRCGPYRLLKVVGRGGMGVVYLAERDDGEVQQTVAVKILRFAMDRPDLRLRFIRERQILASLQHPGIATMLDAGHTADGQPYLVMEYIDGVPIDVYCHKLDLREKLELFVKVCDAVAYAHRNLVIHRDLKPTNIVIDGRGQPKLLDFGIALILESTSDQTRTSERLLTPDYASPEQVRGQARSTATDVYSLGALLYNLLTGRSPHRRDGAAITDEASIVTSEPARPSRIQPNLPKDLDFILAKALRKEPHERYASVEAFADDLHAVLTFRPVKARSGNAWYRARRFLRRYWMPAAALAASILALSAGLYVANRERAVAQRRFAQVRQLANEFIELDGVIRTIPGSTAARHRIVKTSAEYLERLGAEARQDRELALDIGSAWLEVARVQGLPSGPNLGDLEAARASLTKADSLLAFVLTSGPPTRTALLRSAEIAHEQMIVASTMQQKDAVIASTGKIVERYEALAKLGPLSETETTVLSRLLSNVGMAHYNMQLYPEAVQYARRAVQLTGAIEPAQRYRATSLSVMANSLRNQGDLDGALQAITESKRVAERLKFPTDNARIAVMNPVILREGMLLGQHDNINLGRPDEALRCFRNSLDMLEAQAARDSKDARSRIVGGSTCLELVGLLTETDAAGALSIADRCLVRLREVRNNADARRGEAMLLAASSYGLRRLQRTAEATQRIELALKLLRETGEYPAGKINPEGEVDLVLRALADQHDATGNPAEAVRVYRELLDGITAFRLNPERDMLQANALARVWRGLAKAYRQSGQLNEATETDKRRRALWETWNQRIPDNVYVKKQLEAMP